MKTLATLLAVATFAASPAFAQSPKVQDQIIVGDKYVGQDPDPAVRSQMLRDYDTHAGGGAQ
jgi:hypothetical protein